MDREHTGATTPARNDRGGARARRRFLGIALAAAALVALLAAAERALPRRRSGPSEGSSVHAERTVLGEQIAFYAARAQRDPSGVLDLAQLAGLYLQRARERGDHGDIHRAEEAARRALANSGGRSAKALSALASSLMAQHRFPEALQAASTLCQIEPDEPAYRAMLGEIQLELGDYDGARETFEPLRAGAPTPAVAARLARWAELTGRLDDAIRIMIGLRDEAERDGEARSDLAVWYSLRAGDLLAARGRATEAGESYDRGLRVRPHDHRLLAARARLAAAQWDWASAIEYAESSLATVTEPATLALVGDAHFALGDTANARGAYESAEALWRAHDQPFERAYSRFRLEHGGDPESLVALLEDEAAIRPDVQAYHLLAWAYHARGDLSAASEAIARALRAGAEDALVHYHAAVIAGARGETDAARIHLEAALALNPIFHAAYARHAHAWIDSLRAISSGASTSAEAIAGGADGLRESQLAPGEPREALRSPGGPSLTIVATPNPFRASVELRIAAANGIAPTVASDASLEIVTVEGRIVRRIPLQARDAAHWDGRDASGHALPSGVYFARITGGAARSAVRLVKLD